MDGQEVEADLRDGIVIDISPATIVFDGDFIDNGLAIAVFREVGAEGITPGLLRAFAIKDMRGEEGVVALFAEFDGEVDGVRAELIVVVFVVPKDRTGDGRVDFARIGVDEGDDDAFGGVAAHNVTVFGRGVGVQTVDAGPNLRGQGADRAGISGVEAAGFVQNDVMLAVDEEGDFARAEAVDVIAVEETDIDADVIVAFAIRPHGLEGHVLSDGEGVAGEIGLLADFPALEVIVARRLIVVVIEIRDGDRGVLQDGVGLGFVVGVAKVRIDGDRHVILGGDDVVGTPDLAPLFLGGAVGLDPADVFVGQIEESVAFFKEELRKQAIRVIDRGLLGDALPALRGAVEADFEELVASGPGSAVFRESDLMLGVSEERVDVGELFMPPAMVVGTLPGGLHAGFGIAAETTDFCPIFARLKQDLAADVFELRHMGVIGGEVVVLEVDQRLAGRGVDRVILDEFREDGAEALADDRVLVGAVGLFGEAHDDAFGRIAFQEGFGPIEHHVEVDELAILVGRPIGAAVFLAVGLPEVLPIVFEGVLLVPVIDALAVMEADVDIADAFLILLADIALLGKGVIIA